MKKNVNRSAVIIDGGKIRFNDIIAVARYGVAVKISKDATFVRKMKKTRDISSSELQMVSSRPAAWQTDAPCRMAFVSPR